jgi:hypothetical protein
MKQLVYIALATVLTFASAYSFGALLLRVLRVRLYRSEERFFAFIAGSAMLSTLVFLLAVAGFARKSVFLAATLPVIAFAVWRGVHRPSGEDLPPVSLAWRVVFWGGFVAFTGYYVPTVLLPESSPDGVAYHVALVARYVREQRIPPITTSMYANLSQGLEMLFLYAFSIGRHTAAATAHFLFLLTLPFGMLSYARRIQRPEAGVVAALLFYAAPIVGRTGTIAYVDVAAAAVAFALFYALQIWRERQDEVRLVALAGLFAGFGYAIKYPGGVGVVYAALFIAFWTARNPAKMFRYAAIAALCALAVMSPWLVKNAVWLGNPFSPFLNAWFPNPYVYASFERDYVNSFRAMGGVTLAEIPLEVTVRGERLQGLLGPVFLFAPFGLLALRWRCGRQVLLAAAIFLVPYFGNIGARFLIPALPFLSLALALGVQQFRGVLPMVLAAHLFYSWPAVVPAYSAQYAWRLEPTRWDAALRRTPEHEYLDSRLDEFPIVQIMDAVVQPGERIFSPSLGGRAYHRQDVVIGYESAFGNRIQDMLYRAISDDLHTTHRFTFALPATPIRRIRVVQTQRLDAPAQIGEIRVYRDGLEIPRAPEWRLRASDNPWEVQAAFDNSPLTVWMPGRATEPGIFIQIDFGAAIVADRMTINVPRVQNWLAMRIETDSGDGRWSAVEVAPLVDETGWPPRARSLVAQEMKDAGIRWIAVRDVDLLAGDLFERAERWGIREVAYARGIRLWRID